MVEVMAETIQAPDIKYMAVHDDIISGYFIKKKDKIATPIRFNIKTLCHAQNLNLFDKLYKIASIHKGCQKTESKGVLSTSSNAKIIVSAI